MKWEVCSVSHIGGTEVLGIVEADHESDAAQRANEKYRPCWGGEDIIIRPIPDKPRDQWTKEDWRRRGESTFVSSGDEEEPEEKQEEKRHQPDKYSFRVEAGDEYFDGCVKDTLYLKFDRDTALHLLQDIITKGLGQEKDKFELRVVGKLDYIEEL